MSKSLGNSITIRDAVKMYDYEVIKYLMLSKHYSSDIDIHDEDYVLAEKQLYYFYNTISAAEKYAKIYNGDANGERVEDDSLNTIKENL